MSLISLGTVALDNIKTASGYKKGLLGGSAAHFSMSARLFNDDLHLTSIVGQDFPMAHLKMLVEKGINIDSVLLDEGKTFQWKGEYKLGDYNSAITLATELGVLADYKPQIAPGQEKIPYVFLANLDPDMQMQFLKLMKKTKLVGLDSMNLWIDIKRKSLLKLLKKVDLFVANDGEAQSLTGETNLIKAAKKLAKMGPEYVVVKKGEHGVLFYCDKYMFSFPAFPVETVVDPTGAGDTFAGGLMGYLSKEKKMTEAVMRQAVLYATTCASFNVEGFGNAQTEPLTMAKVNKRLKQLIRFIKC